MKIGFHLIGGEEWQAGITHLKVFLYALRQNYHSDVTICLLASNNKGTALGALGEVADEILPIPAFRKWTPSWGIDRAIKTTLSNDFLVSRVLKGCKVDVVFGLSLPFRYTGIPTLSWVYDFQHTHLPEMFSRQERLTRDWTFSRSAKVSTRIIVMSEFVKRDFESFFPDYAHKARVLKTASYVPQSIYETDPKLVTQLYQLPEKFVYLPNQFWKHKNHEIVFRTVKLLRDRGIQVFVACSGYQGDNRHPRYFIDLQQKVSEWRIENQLRFLGLIPRGHVLQLMRQSIYVLNPSLFEGFGLSVDEARSVGKRVLLSDIPAHREQNVPLAVFFDPQSCEDLVEKLGRIWCDTLPGPDLELEFQARESFPERLRACGESFMAVIREVADG